MPTTVIIVSAHFTAYTYIEPFMVQIGELDPNLATIILLVFGVSGITASVIFNRLYRFGPTQFISTAMILLAVSLAFMLVSASYTATMFTLAFYLGYWHFLYRTGITNACTATCTRCNRRSKCHLFRYFQCGYWCRRTVW